MGHIIRNFVADFHVINLVFNHAKPVIRKRVEESRKWMQNKKRKKKELLVFFLKKDKFICKVLILPEALHWLMRFSLHSVYLHNQLSRSGSELKFRMPFLINLKAVLGKKFVCEQRSKLWRFHLSLQSVEQTFPVVEREL